MSNWIKGPNDKFFYITDHARSRWEHRCPHVDLTTFEHAVQFSRFFGEAKLERAYDKGKIGAIIYYEFEKLLFIAKRPIKTDRPDCYWITTVYSTPYAPRWFGLKDFKMYQDFCWWEKHEEKEKSKKPGENKYKDMLNWYYKEVNKEGRRYYGIIQAIRKQTLQA